MRRLVGLGLVGLLPALADAQCYQWRFEPLEGPLPTAVIGQHYDVLFDVCCWGGYEDFSVTGALPPGFVLRDHGDGTADLIGNPSVVGTWAFDVGVTGQCGYWGQSYSLSVVNQPGCGTMHISPATLPTGTLGSAYSQQLAGIGGTAPYEFQVLQGVLPPGLTLSVAGLLSGTTSAGGVFPFRVGVRDAFLCTAFRDYTIGVSCPPIASSPYLPAQGTLGSFYHAWITASGGSAPYTIALAGGSLPAGISLSSVGYLHGTPQESGVFPFIVLVTDAFGCLGAGQHLMVVRCTASASISPSFLPDAEAGEPYQVQLHASGGQAPHTFQVASGALPAGVTLITGGLISGTPPYHGRQTVGILAVDAVGCPVAQSYSFAVRGRPSYVLGQGHGQPNPNRVRLVDQGGTSHADFHAYGAGQWGVNVAAGDIAGDAGARALTGPGPGAVFGPHVRAFLPTGAPMGKVSFYAYGTLKHGVDVAAAALDGDVYDEIVTGAGPGVVFPPHVRGFEFDGVAVQAMPKVSFLASSYPSYGARVSAGDLDGDRYAELLTAPGPGATYAPSLRGFYYRGTAITPMTRVAFDAFPAPQYGAEAACGDVDADLYDEMAAAPGPGPGLPSRFRGFGFDDVSVSALPGFDAVIFGTMYGGVPALGDLAPDGREDLAVGAGPDPAATARLKLRSYDGTRLVGEPMFLTAFPGGYGLQVGAGGLDL